MGVTILSSSSKQQGAAANVTTSTTTTAYNTLTMKEKTIVRFVVLVLGVVAVRRGRLVTAQITDLAMHAEKCAAKYPQAKADFEAYASTGNFTRNMKCSYACVCQESGKMSSDGRMVMAKEFDRVPHYVREVLQPCYLSEPGTDHCETAYRWMLCVQDKEGELQARRAAEEKFQQGKHVPSAGLNAP